MAYPDLDLKGGGGKGGVDACLPSAFFFTRNNGASPRFAIAELSNGSFVTIIARETASEIDRARNAIRLGETIFFFSLLLNNKFTLGEMKFIISK